MFRGTTDKKLEDGSIPSSLSVGQRVHCKVYGRGFWVMIPELKDPFIMFYLYGKLEDLFWVIIHVPELKDQFIILTCTVTYEPNYSFYIYGNSRTHLLLRVKMLWVHCVSGESLFHWQDAYLRFWKCDVVIYKPELSDQKEQSLSVTARHILSGDQ